MAYIFQHNHSGLIGLSIHLGKAPIITFILIKGQFFWSISDQDCKNEMGEIFVRILDMD